MKYAQLIQNAESYVTQLFQENAKPELLYHTLTHTREVVRNAEQISAHYQLSEEDIAVIHIAAWFHDAGYLLGVPEQHEESGAQRAAEFLEENGVEGPMIDKIKGCILATKLPQSPNNLLEQIICDADLFHLGSENFSEKSKLMRKEKEMLLGADISGSAWRVGTIHLFENHHYFTDYVQTLLKKGKEENFAELKKKQEKKMEEMRSKLPLQPSNGTEVIQLEDVEIEPRLSKKERKAEEKRIKESLPTRGVETMFRLTSSNHLDLSSMADSKAHIMISVNSIIVSVLVSVLLRHLEDHPHLIAPTIIFLTVNVLTIIFAVLATRPNVTKGTFTRDDIQQKRANLLFFGNFHRMTLHDYEWGMKTMMTDRDFLYSSMIRDIYFLGVVLGKKYRLLRISYNIFMFGFVIAALSFAVAILFFQK